MARTQAQESRALAKKRRDPSEGGASGVGTIDVWHFGTGPAVATATTTSEGLHCHPLPLTLWDPTAFPLKFMKRQSRNTHPPSKYGFKGSPYTKIFKDRSERNRKARSHNLKLDSIPKR